MAHVVLVFTLIIWSFSFLAAARLRQDLGLVDALAARFLPVLLGAGVLLRWRRPLRLPRTAWWRIVVMGILGVPVYNLAFLHGLKTVPTGTAALNPPLANLWAWLFEGARLKPPFLLGAGVLLASVAAIVLPLPRVGGARPSETSA